MFKYFIGNDTRIILTSGTKRLSFPLHPGIINIDYKYNFRLTYPKTNFERVSRFAEKIYKKGVTCSYNTQMYRIYGKNINIVIPYTFHKTIQIPENSLVSVCWEDSSDLLNTVKIITPEQAQEFIKEELLQL